jgi:metallophosphoesterase (TIGR00282 family)
MVQACRPRAGRPGAEHLSDARILFIGEIVGSSGVFTVKSLLPQLRHQYGVGLVIANGEGATGGFGIGKNHAVYLHKLGVDVITTGDCVYFKKDMVPHIAKARYMLRPCNYPWDNPGRGWLIAGQSRKIGVVNVLGQSGFSRVHLANPYHVLPKILERMRGETNAIVVDYHAATTAEKGTLSHFLKGQVTAVIGTHQKVQTADERILDGGTAAITDVGRTGSLESVGGLLPEIEIRKFLSQIPEPSRAAWDRLELQGVLLDVDEEGHATRIERLRVPCTEVPNAGKGNSGRGR